MTLPVFVAVALAGGLGAACRFVLDTTVKRLFSPTGRLSVLPWGTMVVNLSGSFALGFVVAWAAQVFLPDVFVTVVSTGFLGGYTTFSTASFETVQLLRAHRGGCAFVNSVLTLAAAVGCALLGMWLGYNMQTG